MKQPSPAPANVQPSIATPSDARKLSDALMSIMDQLLKLIEQETALVHDQRGGCVAFGEQFAQLRVQTFDVFLDELRQCGHVMRTAAFPG